MYSWRLELQLKSLLSSGTYKAQLLTELLSYPGDRPLNELPPCSWSSYYISILFTLFIFFREFHYKPILNRKATCAPITLLVLKNRKPIRLLRPLGAEAACREPRLLREGMSEVVVKAESPRALPQCSRGGSLFRNDLLQGLAVMFLVIRHWSKNPWGKKRENELSVGFYINHIDCVVEWCLLRDTSLCMLLGVLACLSPA